MFFFDCLGEHKMLFLKQGNMANIESLSPRNMEMERRAVEDVWFASKNGDFPLALNK